MHQQMCITGRPLSASGWLGGLLSEHPDQSLNKHELSSEKVHQQKLEDDKRATTNVQNGLVFFFFFS